MPPKKPTERIRINARYLGEIGDWISELPRNLRGKATVKIAEFMLEKFAFYVKYKFFSRAQAYGMDGAGGDWTYVDKRTGKTHLMEPVPGYFSARQVRYVFGVLAKKYDFGYPHRTGEIQRGWEIKYSGQTPTRRTTAAVVNDKPGVEFLYSPTQQARQPAGVGWNTTETIIKENENEALEIVLDFLNEERPPAARTTKKRTKRAS